MGNNRLASHEDVQTEREADNYTIKNMRRDKMEEQIKNNITRNATLWESPCFAGATIKLLLLGDHISVQCLEWGLTHTPLPEGGAFGQNDGLVRKKHNKKANPKAILAKGKIASHTIKNIRRRKMKEQTKQPKQPKPNSVQNAVLSECPYCSGTSLKLLLLGDACDHAAIQCLRCGLTHLSFPKGWTLDWNDDSVREKLVENHTASIDKIDKAYQVSTIIEYDKNDIIHVRACIEATPYSWSNLKSRIDRAIGLNITEPRDIVPTRATAVLVSPEMDGLISCKILEENVSWEKIKDIIASSGAYINTKIHRLLIEINKR